MGVGFWSAGRRRAGLRLTMASFMLVGVSAVSTVGLSALEAPAHAGAPSCASGTLASLITGLDNAGGVAVSGSDLFVVNQSGNSVGEYTTSGTTVSRSCTTTSLSGGGKSGPTISVPKATAVADHATLSGTHHSTATGTVTYTVYSNSRCTVAASKGSPQTITTHGTLPASKPVSLSAAVKYYWQASYSGNGNNLSSKSTCGSEVETVT